MKISKNVALQDHSTMRLGGTAAFGVDIHNEDELVLALEWAKDQNLPVLIIGGGSNVVWRDETFNGLLLVDKILGYEAKLSGKTLEVKIGAGEEWDDIVDRTVSAGATGIESLSLIPGTTGATPIQNVGAYGQEISQTLISVYAYDLTTHQFVTITNAKCDFSYRNSRFKSTDRGRFFITRILLKLELGNPKPPFYPAVQEYLDQHPVDQVTPADVRRAVIAIRTAKLPDPKIIANNGSFFGNPIINQSAFDKLKKNFPDAVSWNAGHDLVKLSAAWLIEQSGFANVHDQETGMATWDKQPLVLVNEHAHSTADLLKFKQKIVNAVKAKFDVKLAQEPELLPPSKKD